jgi:hypothetical protein
MCKLSGGPYIGLHLVVGGGGPLSDNWVGKDRDATLQKTSTVTLISVSVACSRFTCCSKMKSFYFYRSLLHPLVYGWLGDVTSCNVS